MLVVCYAYEGFYHGLHGIDSSAVLEVSDDIEKAQREIDEWGNEESAELIYSYGLEDDYLDEDDEDADIEDSMYYEDRGWYAHKIKDTNLSVEELDKELCHLGMDLFIDEYCEKEPLY